MFVTDGPVQRMDPLNNLQVAIKNNLDVFYFSCTVPYNVLFTEDGQMGKADARTISRVFLPVIYDINNLVTWM